MGTMLSLPAIEREVVLLRYRRQGVPYRVSPFFVENLKKTTEAKVHFPTKRGFHQQNKLVTI
jgi:hypothetical protein